MRSENPSSIGENRGSMASPNRKQNMKHSHPIYLLVGAPCSGKTWIIDQAKDFAQCVEHDASLDNLDKYAGRVANAACAGIVVADIPFKGEEFAAQLSKLGLDVHKLYVLVRDGDLKQRYFKRNGKLPHQYILNTNKSIMEHFQEGEFAGDSTHVLEYLNGTLGSSAESER
jgi:hypothetical protein